jgi:hypothetical protein
MAMRRDPLLEITRALVLAGYRVISSAGDEVDTARAVGLELVAGEVLELEPSPAPRRAGTRGRTPGTPARRRGRRRSARR